MTHWNSMSKKWLKGDNMSNRIERANSEILRCLSIIFKKLNDPRLSQFLTVNEVNVTPDFKFCKVKISLLEDDIQKAEQCIEILKKSEGFIKKELAKMVAMPSVPKLMFSFDKGQQNSNRVEELLKKIKYATEE